MLIAATKRVLQLFEYMVSYSLPQILTATVGVQPPILDTFPGDAFESNQYISLSYTSSVYAKIKLFNFGKKKHKKIRKQPIFFW